LKLLIVDDEDLIRQGILFMLQGSGLSFDEIVEAASGRSAVSLARQHSPEIILMDIRMPGLDGISAARQICDFNEGCRIVFLTAYDHFEYAREAVRCKARDFLVKPVSKEDLVKSLRACWDEVSRNKAEKNKEERVKQALFYSVEEFLVNRLLSGPGLSPQQLWSKLRIIAAGPVDTWFGPDRLPNVCLVFEAGERLPAEAVKSVRSLKVAEVSCPVIMEQSERGLICLAWVPESGGRAKDISMGLALELSRLLDRIGCPVRRAGVGKVYTDLKDLRQSHSDALRALDYGTVGSAGEEGFKILHADGIDEDKLYSRPYQVVRKVIKYLEDNYDKRVSLEDAAQQVYLNPVYLSAIIKQETGSTFSDYLTLIRVEKAKKMLAQSLPVKEVAVAVGYPDSNYFCRVFKKVTGDTATGYRKKKSG